MAFNDSARAGRTLGAALCLFCSGLCALIYQTTWLREFRLIFGSSTPASAAVLGIFMGGVGAGSLVLGKKVDRLGNPFLFYGRLEVFIALSAAVTPALIWLVRAIYVGLGGTVSLGLVPGTCLRLALATLVLLPPTFAMGGTLPALARTFQPADDSGRRRVASLYAVNTLGAVTGAVLATFCLLERFGNRWTLWMACALNLVVALAAILLARATSQTPSSIAPPRQRAGEAPAVETVPASRRFVFAAAAVAGFVFFLMELVWYRMLGPLLGGSTFTFGLILAITLTGIAVGSVLYALRPTGRPVLLAGFATVCALEALCVAVPYALGDRLAMLSILLQPIGAMGFGGRIVAWSVLTFVVVFPAAVVAGFQFPMLIGLLGRGRNDVGADTGSAYLWNTIGAIAGSLAGGFGLLPLLSAPGAWRLSVLFLVVLALAGMALAIRGGQVSWSATRPLAVSLLALCLLTAVGPTAAWRHSPIGAGRVKMADPAPNDFEEFARNRRRILLWEAEGRESSVSMTRENGLAFLVNGKADGNARQDAPTQVLCGLLGALLHPNPTRALVVGLGTGSSAGWLGKLPAMERVDVVELEPAMREVARWCAPVNQRVLENPKVNLIVGDAREVILASRDQYDVIASEPSNPYRAGVASLFTKEFYEAAEARLRPAGLFLQWVQAYEIDGRSISTVLATLHSVFPGVEIWQTQQGDLMFIASREPLVHDVARLRARIPREPYRSALAAVWRTTDAEGVFAHFIAGSDLAAAVAAGPATPVTDDRNDLEFAFARTVGRKMQFNVSQLRELAHEQGYDQPDLTGGEIDWIAVADRMASVAVLDDLKKIDIQGDNPPLQARISAKEAYVAGDLRQVFDHWFQQTAEPGDLLELAMVTECLAERGDERVHAYADQLRAWQPGEADAALARYSWRKEQPGAAATLLTGALVEWRDNPWALRDLMERALQLGKALGTTPVTAAHAVPIFEALSREFSVSLLDTERMSVRLEIARQLDRGRRLGLARGVIAEFEPEAPWAGDFLRLRAEVYRASGDERSEQAGADLRRFLRGEERPFVYADRETLQALRSSGHPPASPGWNGTVHAREP